MTHPNAIPTADLRIPVSPDQIRSDLLMAIARDYMRAGLVREAAAFGYAAERTRSDVEQAA